MRLYIVGFMGCGKSTLGKPLAHKLMLEFIDLDSYIEEREKMTIPEIFKELGEDYFRKIEAISLRELSDRENVVIATGGGAPLFYDNMDYMNSKGTTIYLKVNSGILTSRVAGARSKRPLLKDKTDQELREYIDTTLAKREEFYNNAMIIIEGKNISVGDIIEEVKKW